MDKVLLFDYYSALFAAFIFARQLHSQLCAILTKTKSIKKSYAKGIK